MLARHADDLYWSSRYLDRIEVTARLLDVTTHSYGGLPDEQAESVWRAQFAALLIPEDNYQRAYDRRGISETLVFDEENPSSLASLVDKVRATARAIREQLSTETWEAINLLFLELNDRDVERDTHERFFQLVHSVRSRCHAIAGAAYETMARDAAWHFFVVGRALERAAFSARFLRAHREVKAPQHGVFHHQVLLRCLGAFEGFVRHSLRQPEFESVADFAMLSRSFPNSLLSSLERLEAQLEALTDGNRESRPRQIAGMIRSGLEYHGLVEGEPAMDSLDEIISGLGLLSEAVTERFFTGDAVIQSGMTHVGGRL